LNADFHGPKLCNVPGEEIAGFAREIAKSADKMLIDLLGKLSLWPVAFQGRLFNR